MKETLLCIGGHLDGQQSQRLREPFFKVAIPSKALPVATSRRAHLHPDSVLQVTQTYEKKKLHCEDHTFELWVLEGTKDAQWMADLIAGYAPKRLKNDMAVEGLAAQMYFQDRGADGGGVWWNVMDETLKAKYRDIAQRRIAHMEDWKKRHG